MESTHTEAMKYDGEKVRLDLLPVQPIIEIGKVLTYGARKYEKDNWRKGLEWSRCYAATLRHLFAWQSGETNDPETGLSHLAHAACEILFLLEFARTHPELDDRPNSSFHNVEAKTLLDIVKEAGFNEKDIEGYCPASALFIDAFQSTGYKQPSWDCPHAVDNPAVACVSCWNRPAEKPEPEKPKVQLDPLEAIKPADTPPPDPLAWSWIDCVKEFNRAYGIEAPTKNYTAMYTQSRLVREECRELTQAVARWASARYGSEQEHAAQLEILDAICDSIYVLIGLALKMGFNLDGAFREVHRSNMSKLNTDGKPIKREDGKILKGPNFTPPNLEPYI